MTVHSWLHIRAWRLGLLSALLLAALAQAGEDRPVTQVGMRGHIDGVVLPGPELEVRPLADSQAPFVLRIANVSPHGTSFRYDFVYYALEPHTYDLTQYLRPKDGSKGGKLQPLVVEVQGLLGPGLVHPHALEPKRASWFARYWLLLLLGAVLWVLGFFLILFWGRKKKRSTGQHADSPATLADRLRPLVVRAMTGKLTTNQQAELERALLAYWRRRLGLEKENAQAALATMRNHPEAGVLLNQLEIWLHRPGTANHVDLGKLLKPYQQASAEDLTEPANTHGVTA